jgi:hypothetical protein
MAQTDVQARKRMLDVVADGADELARALASLEVAYELLDERAADALEQQLFMPVQRAYGRAKSAHSGFAQRHALAQRRFQTPPAPAPSLGTAALVERAAEAVGRADATIATLQDSLMPVEVGEGELRGALSEARTLIDGFAQRTKEFVRTLGR